MNLKEIMDALLVVVPMMLIISMILMIYGTAAQKFRVFDKGLILFIAAVFIFMLWALFSYMSGAL